MARIRTVDLLPEIFRTPTNRKFLAATLDQLTQEPNIKQIQGFVGRRVGPGVNPDDSYVVEPTAQRADYQLEPGVVSLRPDTNRVQDVMTYPGLLSALDVNGGFTQREDRLWQSQYYAYDPFCDLDKFTNYSEYYWLPNGPDAVDVTNVLYPVTDDFVVERQPQGYDLSGLAGSNPEVILVRGGNYRFIVDQPGASFWIQSSPGSAGTLNWAPNISSRDVLGVSNNGAQQGMVTFDVPLKTAQDQFYNMPLLTGVDLLSDLKFDEINNVPVSTFLALHPQGIDGITNLNGRTVIFSDRSSSAEQGGWIVNDTPDGDQGFDLGLFDNPEYIESMSQRYSIWRINYRGDPLDPYLQLESILEVPSQNRVNILFGDEYSNTQWWKDVEGYWSEVPLLTAVQDVLYYQDGTETDRFGVIRLIDPAQTDPLDIASIIGAQQYTSPNGVRFTNGLKVIFRGTVSPAEFQDQEYYVEGVGTGPGLSQRVGFVDGQAYYGPFHVVSGQKVTGLADDSVFQQFIYDTIQDSIENRGRGTPELAPLPVTSQSGAVEGNGIRLVPVASLITPEAYIRDQSSLQDPTDPIPLIPDYLTMNRSSQDRNAWSRSNRWFHQQVITDTARYNNDIPVLDNQQRARRPIIEFRANIRLFDSGTQAIDPVDIIDFGLVPVDCSETLASTDVIVAESTLDLRVGQKISFRAPTLGGLLADTTYYIQAVVSSTQFAVSTTKGGSRLSLNSAQGSMSGTAIQDDALSYVAGEESYTVDGYQLVNGTRIIFAQDLDPQVRNRVFRVDFIDPDGSPGSQPIINLVPLENSQILQDQMVLCLQGDTQQGLSYWYNGAEWQQVQPKTQINQAPLFDVFDIRGRSFGDTEVYPSTTFRGSRLFGYAVGQTGRIDPVLGFSLRYLNINNIGDIVFDNFFYTDTFVYLQDNTGTTLPVSSGVVHQYIDRVTFSDLIGWLTAASENRSRQTFRFTYAQEPLVLDIPVLSESTFAPVQVFVGGIFQDPDTYTVDITNTNTVISLLDPPASGTVIEVQVLSDQPSAVGFYDVPSNLEYNPLNQDSDRFTLGSIRNHYQSICQNLNNIQGPIIGSNNSRDLGNILTYGQNIVQQSSPVTLAGVFLRDPAYDIFGALRFNSQAYEKFKATMMDLVAKGDFINTTIPQILDDVIEEMGLGRTELSPFYWSDMLPSNETYVEIDYVVSPITINIFDLSRIYDFSSSNFQSVMVYRNGAILTRGTEYEVGVDSATVTVLIPLVVGDVISVREYSSTFGSYVPNTPTKMGLYPAYRPEKYLDNSYAQPQQVIRGHDGSITRAYGDLRDDVLLEFEKRIFNNLKIQSPIPIQADEVIPGKFRTTDYTQGEVTNILSQDFLSWVGWNRLDYTTQDYNSANAFSYNYSQSGDRINNQPLLGAWRGIYEYFYDTTAPNTRPWEMLGFSQEPDWWQQQYGPPPYTSGNLVLWEDLANGIVADPEDPRVLPRRRRPELLSVIPSDSEGNLLSPLDAVVGLFDNNSFRRSWTVGDDGPTEAAWRASSSYPFAVMRLLALTRPAEFFSLFADRDRYRFDDEIQQYLWDNRYRLDANLLAPIYGNGQSRASFINWIVDFNRQTGVNSTSRLESLLSNIDVRLVWRLAGFSDKKLLKIYVERSTPGGSNSGFLLPDESYQILLYENQPQSQLAYSSVIVQKTERGWSVDGYDIAKPYFNIIASRARGITREISGGGEVVRVPAQYTDNVVQVPYGFVFTNPAAVCDFLLSYGEYLSRNGMTFEALENGLIIDWNQMAVEFLYWNAQGWTPGSLINLNPVSNDITITRPGEIAVSLDPSTARNIILNQNRQPISSSELLIDRLENTVRLQSLTASTINFVNFVFTTREHALVFDNSSLFGDLLYEPRTGIRQSRVLASGWVTGDWNGQVNAPGFVLNQDNVRNWIPNQAYTKGEIVLFKDQYWSARDIVQPSEEFDYSQWLKSDFDEIQLGLLNNAATVSNELAQAYDTQAINLEADVDTFSFGLIGFRPRQYMESLNLDDVSQVNLYKQFLRNKGTRGSLELFTLADFRKEIAEYNVYEYWSLLQGTYGATANRSYIELLLDQSRLVGDPSLIQIIEPGQASVADQTVFPGTVWKSSFPVTSPDVLPTTTIRNPDQALASAGFVNIDDVDFTTFSLDAVDIAASDIDIGSIGVGTTIWVAKVNAYDWNVFRCRFIPADVVAVSDNLEGRSLVTFNGQHGLVTGQQLIIRFFDEDIDGIYRVEAVPTLDSVIIEYTLQGFESTITGIGTSFTLESVRVSQPADIAQQALSRQLLPGARVWVNDNGQGLWQVLEKTQPFVSAPDLAPDEPEFDSGYGTALSQGLLNLTALVGAPRFGQDLSTNGASPGAVQAFVKNNLDQYVFAGHIELDTTDVAGFGCSIDLGNQSWAVVGANLSNDGQGYAAMIYNPPYSDIFEQRQILIALDQDWTDASFGSSVTMSQDEQWVYVGAPGSNKVYAYARVDIQPQSVSYTANGTASAFSYAGNIIVDSSRPQQIQVLLDGRLLFVGNNTPGVTSIAGGNVQLNFTPESGQIVSLSRRTSAQLDRRLYYNTAPSEVVSTETSDENLTARFTVDVTRGVRSPSVTDGGTDYYPGDIITIYGNAIGGGSDLSFEVTQVGQIFNTLIPAVAGESEITVSVSRITEIQDGQELIRISGAGDFGAGTTVVSRDLATGVITLSAALAQSGPIDFMASPNPITEIGSITGINGGIGNTATFNVLDQLATATDISAFTITVDRVIQRPLLDYTYSAGNVTFSVNPPQGSEILVDSRDHYQYVAALTVPGLGITDTFGASVTSTTDGRQLIVGNPTADVGNSTNAGRAYVWDRAVEQRIVSNASVMTYTTETNMVEPVSVSIDGRRLLNADVNVGGQFTVDAANNTVTLSNVSLQVGDSIEIETNDFTVLQIIESTNPNPRADFGTVVDQCVNDCSLYISAPNDSTFVRRGGSVEFYQNQARIYGTIESRNANPVLTVGEHIRINDVMVQCTGTAVGNIVADINGTVLPNAQATASPDLLLTGDGLTQTFDVGNVYSSASAYNTVVYVDDVLQTSGVDYTYDNDTEILRFETAPDLDSEIRVVSGRITISVINPESASPLDQLSVLPGTGNLFSDLGFDIYYPQQIITSPVPQQQSGFGSSMFISDDTLTLIVGAPTGSMILPTTFDRDRTRFDADSTNFSETIAQSGAVYEYDFLPAREASIQNPGQFAFGQQITRQGIREFDRFGSAVDLTTGTLLIGSPGNDLGDSEVDFGTVMQLVNTTRAPSWRVLRQQTPSVDVRLLNTIFMYDRFAQANKQYFDFFDPLQGRLLGAVAQNLDYIGAQDPANYNVGPLNNAGQRWTQDHVGQIWWDTTRARFIDPNQNDPVYASQRWGQLFPGSAVEIYQWVSSPVAPADYTGPGVPRSTESYVISAGVDEQGLFITTYFFWVSGVNTVDRTARKTLGITTLARYIENPKSSGISYVAPLGPGLLAIYNGSTYVQALDTVLHVEFDREFNDTPVHQEFQLIAQDLPESFLNPRAYLKFIDSLSGIDSDGRLVPDPFLPPSELYGVKFSPRQSMFAQRLTALQNYLQAANRVLLTFPAAESRTFNLLNSSQPEPTQASGAWNLRVATYEELTYQDIYAVSLGYRYLVASDSTNNGLWTIYQVVALGSLRELQLIQVQTYDTRLYWQRVDWYEPGFDPLTRIVRTVPNVAGLRTLDVPEGSAVKVLANAQGLFEIYVLRSGSWTRVALEDGTIQFSARLWDYALGRYGFDSEVFDAQYFDQEPAIETRRVIQAINQEIFIDDLAIERNRLLMLMFDFILTEQTSPDWLTKSSLIDVSHLIRELEPFQIYRQDNQDFVLNYIQEVKPYHVQIRDFNLRYRGQDQYRGDLTDFDLPAFWDTDINAYVSPVLDPDNQIPGPESFPPTSALWQTFPYDQWFRDYRLSIGSVDLVLNVPGDVSSGSGSGYTVPPQVTVSGQCLRQAQMRAVINSQGNVSAIIVDDPGLGYLTTALISIQGGNGSGAQAVARMIGQGRGFEIGPNPESDAEQSYNLVRSFTTSMRFDRYQYTSDIVDWRANVSYDNGTLVRYLDRVYRAESGDSTPVSGPTFDPDQWVLVPASDLTGLDRTRGYYAPGPTMPGLDLAQVISGLEYPGVQVMGVPFPLVRRYLGDGSTTTYAYTQATQPWGDISQPDQQITVIVDQVQQIPIIDYTVDTANLQIDFTQPPVVNSNISVRVGYPFDLLGDAIYSSSFQDVFLGTRPTDINVDGGRFVGPFESHAPEELIPGIEFDTLDMRVFTTPGSDWQGPGHGFPLASLSWDYDSSDPTFDFSAGGEYPAQVRVWDINTGLQLIPDVHYTVDWAQREITVISPITDGDILRVVVYELGGGNQLFRGSYNGAEIGDRVTVPINRDIIFGVTAFVNGQDTPVQYINEISSTETEIVFFSTWTDQDLVVVTVFGSNTNNVNYSWSTPQTQYFVYDGVNSFALTNSLQGTNPINVVVNVNGQRANPAGSVRYVSDGVETIFFVPRTAGYNEDQIQQSQVRVYVGQDELVAGVDWTLDPDDLSTQRTVTLTTAPEAGELVTVSVGTGSPYNISGTTMSWDTAKFALALGDIVSVTTWNDTQQQDITTQVWQGPIVRTSIISVSQGYDVTIFDQGNATGQPGSFDYGIGSFLYANRFDTGRVITDPTRLIVTIDGQYLFPEQGFTVEGSVVIFPGNPISLTSIVAITVLDMEPIPGQIGFRIFQDMRGQQSTYRITEASTTVLTQDLAQDADIAYIRDASRLPLPDLPQNLFGAVTIDGEKLLYRDIDFSNNTISGLRRGVSGTAAAAHRAGALVYDISDGNLLPQQYQDALESQQFVSDGSTTQFTTDSIDVSISDSTELLAAVRVWVAGIQLEPGPDTYTVTAGNPVSITLAVAPPEFQIIEIAVLRGQTWYQPAAGEPSNGRPLQETMTLAARFIRGD